ncbi:MAG: OmpA family protein [Deltaproteobacteria bacterium]|nr:OmpA family protein [Deltaproteobacteria bacterium]
MRRSHGFWVLWGLALIGINGCALTPKQKQCVTVGGITGAVLGAGAGAGIGPELGLGKREDRAVGIAAGAGIGALIGGLAGYWMCGPEEPPPPAPRAATPPPPPPPPAPAPVESKRIVLRGINFDFNKSDIKKEFVPVLDEAAQILKDNPNVKVTVEGHTDSKGTDEYNQKLSERRANAVKAYLTTRGVDASRLDTIGKGESEPIADNTKNGKDNPEGRAMNRRAELKVK